MLTADGFDKAFLGIAIRAGQEDIVAYDFDKCVAILCERDNMELDDAIEYMYYNVVGAWMGDKTPIFIRQMNDIRNLEDVD